MTFELLAGSGNEPDLATAVNSLEKAVTKKGAKITLNGEQFGYVAGSFSSAETNQDTAEEPIKKSGGAKIGLIVGIVIGVLVVIAIVVAIGVVIYQKKKNGNKVNQSPRESRAGKNITVIRIQKVT